ncbi:unnamed protein product, partial [Ascophyllum nodosum]
MCKSNPTTPTAPTAPTAKDEENYVFREITSAEVNDQEHRELVEQHTANDVVVFGAFVAGSLVGIVVAAPVIFVLVLGTGAAALTSSESKAGKIARNVGKVSSDILINILKKWREMNYKYRVTDKMTGAAKRTALRIKGEDKKRGISMCLRTKAAEMWREIDQRTRVSSPRAQIMASVGPSESAYTLE